MRNIDEMIWGPWLLFLLLGTGVLLMARLDFLPLKKLGFALKCAIGADKQRNDISGNKNRNAGEVSPLSALTTELAATIGTGNIVGVATAMVLGGSGALLWMMAAAVPGLATKLVESALSVKYRSRNARGEWTGGPMYTLRNAFPGILGTVLSFCYAFFAVMASFGMGNMTQANSIADACRVAFDIPAALTGLVLTIVTIFVILSGIRGIAKLTQYLVPFMGIFYLLGTLGVIAHNFYRLPQGIGSILIMAFAPEAVRGGLLGQLTARASLSMRRSLRFGVSRGVFSNEAGLGAGGITAASADTKDYIRQGYISMTGVFFDTMVICLVTGLAFVSSGRLGMTNATGELLNGTELVVAVFEDTYGEWGAKFASVSIVLFAFATIIAWAYQGEKAFEFFVKDSRYLVWYRFVYVLIVFLGAICSLEAVWDFSDICNGLMAVPNLVAVLILGLGKNGMCAEIRAYEAQSRKSRK